MANPNSEHDSEGPEGLSLWAELKRRRVVHVGLVYIAVGFVILQVADLLVPALLLPEWMLRMVALFTILGFPIALIIAWAFERTPDGLRRSRRHGPARQRGPPESGASAGVSECDEVSGPVPQAGGAPGALARRRASRIAVAGAVAVLGIAGGSWWLSRPDTPAGGARRGPKARSIAVLPLESLSANPNNAYFAAGVHEAILRHLAAIEDLKTISRTSVRPYADTEKSIPEIARELGVATVLEGSVQRANGNVRITVQLIDAETDEHLWAENYDRKLSDIFAIQTEVAKAIVAALEAELLPEERRQVERRPTDNMLAYDLYLRAREYGTRPRGVEDNLQAAIALYQRAIAEDSTFALAYARLSRAHGYMFWFGFDPSRERTEAAREAAELALALEPDLPYAHLAMGYYYYHVNRDFDRAVREFEIARRGLPNSAEVISSVGYVRRRQGEWEEAIARFQTAIALDPRDAILYTSLGETFAAVSRYSDASRAYGRAFDLAPAGYVAIFSLLPYLARTGSTDSVESVLARVDPGFDPRGHISGLRYMLALSERRYDAARNALEAIPARGIRSQAALWPKPMLAGAFLQAVRDSAAARAMFDSARAHLEAMIGRHPKNASMHNALSLAYARLDRPADALREGRRAVELVPISRDALAGPIVALGLVAIYGNAGMTDQAMDLLGQLASRSGTGNVLAMVRIDPRLEAIRDHPRYQRILGKMAARGGGAASAPR